MAAQFRPVPFFLIVPFLALGQTAMDDKADIRFMDTHTEGDGGADNPGLI